MNLYSIYCNKDNNEYLMINSTTKTYSWKIPLNFSNPVASFLNFRSTEEDFIEYINKEEVNKQIPLIQNKSKEEIINTHPELFI
ncbi:MAG: hypothetical protein PVF17_01520 [Ignavibacteria bacterium]|jgi:hypothetical protein